LGFRRVVQEVRRRIIRVAVDPKIRKKVSLDLDLALPRLAGTT
jgi:hypothetical protein